MLYILKASQYNYGFILFDGWSILQQLESRSSSSLEYDFSIFLRWEWEQMPMLVVGIKGDMLEPKLGSVRKSKLDDGLVGSLVERRLTIPEDTLLKCLEDNALKCQSDPQPPGQIPTKYILAS